MTWPNSIDVVAPAPGKEGISPILAAAVFLLASGTLGFVLRDLRAGYLAVVAAINFLLFLAAWRAVFRSRLSYIDSGIVFVSVVTVYVIIPLITTEAMSFSFGALQDSRLAGIALDDGIISATVANANAIVTGFGAAYLAMRRPRMITLEPQPHNITVALWILLGVAVATQIVVRLSLGSGESYGDEYLIVQSLPIAIIQILNILGSLLYVAIFGLLAIYFSARKSYVALLLSSILILFFLATTGARTPIVLITFAFIVGWDHFYRRISPLVIFMLFVAVITAFLMFGAWRAGEQSLAGTLAQSEFMAVFVTALDIRQIYLTGPLANMGTTLLFGDLLRLVPQQILPFEKIDPASWYVTNFYPAYAAQGGGLAFGMLAEAALSGGYLAALIRGFLLGTVLSLVLNLLTRGRSIWMCVIYIWLVVSVYQCFRDTTFTLFGRFMFQIFPAVLIAKMLSFLLQSTDEANARRLAA